MALFMHQWSYKDTAMKAFVKSPQDRESAVRAAVESFGGELVAFYFAFGVHDGVAICRFDDAQSAMAAMMALFGQGRVKELITTPLLTAEEGRAAMEQAHDALTAISRG